jgi:NADPH2:quinone reductase
MGSAATGAFATQVLTDPTLLAPIPPGLSTDEAAAFRVTYQTAYHALVTVGAVRPGDWVVVLGAAGGVGTAAVDVAVRLGARVLAAASSQERLDVCRQLGAEATVDYSTEDLKVRIKEVTGRGADVVIDPVGGLYSEQALRSTTWGGRFVCLGFASGEIPRIPLNLVLLKGVIVRGMELRTIAEHVPGSAALADQALAALVADGMKPVVSQVFPLDQVAEAMEQVSQRKATGKVVLRLS